MRTEFAELPVDFGVRGRGVAGNHWASWGISEWREYVTRLRKYALRCGGRLPSTEPVQHKQGSLPAGATKPFAPLSSAFIRSICGAFHRSAHANSRAKMPRSIVSNSAEGFDEGYAWQTEGDEGGGGCARRDRCGGDGPARVVEKRDCEREGN